jgi:hypothetical protein
MTVRVKGAPIHVYGEKDLWSATAMELSGRTNAFTMVHTGGCHRAWIRDLSPEQKATIAAAPQQWLNLSPKDVTLAPSSTR